MSKAPTPYRIPLLSEIEQIKWNGFKVASTFSGAGGSCLGYRMAGFKVLWANDCDPAAQASYKLNHHSTILDTRDIRKITANEILDTTGLVPGDLDIFDGSPPCTSFSTAGRREKLWGQKTDHAGISQTMDDLFFEYIRILRGLKPKTFIAENVSGLVKGTAKGYFKIILQELKDSGYRVAAQVLDAQWLGVPQQRQRVIFIGVRDDLKLDPVFPRPFTFRYSCLDAIRDLCPDLVGVGAGFASDREFKDPEKPAPSVVASGARLGGNIGCVQTATLEIGMMGVGRRSVDEPSGTITATVPDKGSGVVRVGAIRRKFTIPEVKRICSFPDDFQLAGSFPQQWARLGNSVPPLMMKAIAGCVRDNILMRIPTPALQPLS